MQHADPEKKTDLEEEPEPQGWSLKRFGYRRLWWALVLIVGVTRLLMAGSEGVIPEHDEPSIESGAEASGEEVEVVSSGQGSGFDWRACQYGSVIPFNLPDPSLNRMISTIVRPDGKSNDNSWTRGVDEFHATKRYCSPWIHGGEGVWSKAYRGYRDGGIQLSALNYRCNWSSSRNTYVCKLL